MNGSAKPLSEMTLEELWQLFPIVLSEHAPDWKQYYEEEKALLEKTFGRLLVRIEHIGSTAVEGLIAKPTVDILLEADPSASPEAVRQTAETIPPMTRPATTGMPLIFIFLTFPVLPFVVCYGDYVLPNRLVPWCRLMAYRKMPCPRLY